MKKIWSISTTLRNPERIRGFLKVLSLLQGEEWSRANQKKLQVLLIQNRVYGTGRQQFYNGLKKAQIRLLESSSDISYKQAEAILDRKNYVGGGDMRGRQSYNPIEKAGLAYIDDREKIRISPLGRYLLREDYEMQEMFFRWLLKWQYPNPDSPRHCTKKDGYDIKPFIGTLHLINEVNKLCTAKKITAKGLSRVEFMLFVPSLIHYTEIKDQARRVIDFRRNFEKLKKNKQDGFVKKYVRMYFRSFQNGTLSNFSNYSDNTLRNFRLSKYLKIRGGGYYYIDLEPKRKIEIGSLLKADNASSQKFETKAYGEYLADISKPSLPWENVGQLKKIFQNIIADINKLEKSMGLSMSKFGQAKNTVGGLKSDIKKLRERRRELQELLIKEEFEDTAKIEEVVYSLRNIGSLGTKPSLALEKWVSIGLQILNDAIKIKPNYIMDDDNNILDTAPGNRPDIECFYDRFNSICEVTMLSNRTQWYYEGQPVMRHIRNFETDHKKEHTYCIFIAPTIHRDTLNTFWIAAKYEYEGARQKIVPLTINQFAEILDIYLQIKKTNKKFRQTDIMDICNTIVDVVKSIENSEKWIEQIPKKIQQWGKRLLN